MLTLRTINLSTHFPYGTSPTVTYNRHLQFPSQGPPWQQPRRGITRRRYRGDKPLLSLRRPHGRERQHHNQPLQVCGQGA